MRKKYIVHFLFFLHFSVVAQIPLVKMTHLSLEEGLSQSNVRCMLQDKNGFLWIGTQDGLNRYDGYNFKVYKNDPSDTNSLSDNMITCLLEDKNGFLWIGTLDGLNKYDQRNGKFTHYFAKRGDGASLQGESILSIAEDHRGNIWVGTHLGGLSKFDLKAGKFKTFLHNPKDEKSISNNNIMSLFVDSKGNIWVGTFGGGLNLYNERTHDFRKFNSIPSDKNTISNDFISDIEEVDEGTLYIGTAAGITVLNINSMKINRLEITTAEKKLIQSSNIQAISKDSKDNLWFGTETDGLIFYDPSNRQIKRYYNDKNISSPLGENNITALCVDENDIIWAGTHSAGLTKLKKTKRNFNNIFADDSKNFGLTDANIWPLFQDSKGNIWVGTNNGLNVLDKNDHLVKKYFHSPNNTNTISNNRIWSINEDHKGNIWVGTQDGLNQIDLLKNRVTRFQYSPNKKSIPFNLIKYVYPDKDGILWLGTWGSGMIRFDPSTMSSKVFHHNLEDRSSISDDVVFYINEDKNGTLWVCTSNGLNKFTKSTGRFTSYVHTSTNKEGIPANAIYFILEDENDNYWLASHGGGLIRFNNSNGKFENYTEIDGLPNNVVYGILRDNSNNFWLSTNRGISKYSPKLNRFKNYNTKDGLPNNECNAGAFLKSNSGKLYFGTINGLTSFHPESLTENKDIPKIAITDFKIFDKRVENISSLVDGDKIALTYNDNYFSFEFAALDFTEPANNQYAYFLKGFDEDWIYSGSRRYAAYTHLDAGYYVFSLRASNNDGVWNNKGITIGITIAPPFWRTWWFNTFVLIFILSLVTFFFKMKMKQLKRESKLQQKFSKQLIDFQEAEKKRIASELHDGIGQNLLIITNRAQVGLMNENVDKIKEHLAAIDETAADSIQEIRNITHHLHPNLLDKIGLTKTLQAMIHKFESSSSLSCTTSFDDIDGIFSPENEVNIYRIVQEGLNNIIKHANAKKVLISISKNKKNVLLLIQDDGIGIDQIKIQNFKISSEGFGLRSLNERVKYLNGNVLINSKRGEGTTLTITIPINHNE